MGELLKKIEDRLYLPLAAALFVTVGAIIGPYVGKLAGYTLGVLWLVYMLVRVLQLFKDKIK